MWCPFCQREFGSTYYELAKHLMRNHHGSTVAGGKTPLGANEATNQIGWPKCWCGAYCWNLTEFGEHLQNRGGLEAHILEIALAEDTHA